MRIPRRHHLFETEALHTLWCVPAWLTDGSIDVSTTDDPDDRDLRRRLLARRLISHQARTQTVTYFTDCSRNQLETLRRRWGVATNERHRGPSPTSFAEFFRNARTLQAATAAAILFNLLDTRRRPGLPPSPGTTKLATGEQICYVYEALQACFPHVELEFEHMVLLANWPRSRRDASVWVTAHSAAQPCWSTISRPGRPLADIVREMCPPATPATIGSGRTGQWRSTLSAVHCTQRR